MMVNVADFGSLDEQNIISSVAMESYSGSQKYSRGGLRPARPPVHLLRTHVRHHRRFQPGARRRVQGITERPAGRSVARELLDRSYRILTVRLLPAANRPKLANTPPANSQVPGSGAGSGGSGSPAGVVAIRFAESEASPSP